jgi:hypothetical protein
VKKVSSSGLISERSESAKEEWRKELVCISEAMQQLCTSDGVSFYHSSAGPLQ